MLALVAMRFLAPACLALIVSLSPVPSPRRSGQGPPGSRALAHRHQPGGRPAPARQPPRRVLRHRIRDRHYPARPGTSPAGREDQRHWKQDPPWPETGRGFRYRRADLSWRVPGRVGDIRCSVTSQPPEVHSPLYRAFGSRCTMAAWRSVMQSPGTITVRLFSGRSPSA